MNKRVKTLKRARKRIANGSSIAVCYALTWINTKTAHALSDEIMDVIGAGEFVSTWAQLHGVVCPPDQNPWDFWRTYRLA